jgi:predicted AlkP superfamily phosphohydrolase/phosphomutase
MQPYKVLVIGMDGATFDLILPWVADNRLPNLASLIQKGTRSFLRSTIPPMTPPAWTSFFTGKNPGKHGVFDFIELKPGSYDFRFTNGASVQAKSLWSLLSEAHKKVGIVNVPMTYPPEKVNGYLISGLDAPDEKSQFTYPAELYKILKEAVGPYQIDIRHLGNMRGDKERDLTLQAFHEIEERRGAAARFLMEKYPADLTVVVFNATDQVQHHFWHYMDPRHPQHDPAGAKKYGQAIFEIYRQVDEEIGKLLQNLSEETIVMIVSDHGAGATSNLELYLNHYLQEIGLLRFESRSFTKNWLHHGAEKVDKLLRGTLSSKQKARLAKFFPQLRTKLESWATAPLDWKSTRAYVNEAYIFSPGIWINLKGKRPQGTVEPGKDYENLIQFLIEKLYELKDPDTGQQVIKKVYRKDEIYHGRYTDQAPDLILSWWEENSFTVKASQPERKGLPILERDLGPIVGGRDLSGAHRLHGVLIMSGGPIKQGLSLKETQILDVAPTILYLMGMPVPGDFDGRILIEAIEEDFLRENPPRYGQDLASPDERSNTGYSEEDMEKIRERLQGIGYLD